MDLKKLDVKRVEIKLGNKYLLKERLGGGSFGQTFVTINQENDARVAAKLEKRSANATLVREAKVISDMRGEIGFPSLYDYGKEEDYNYIIISLLGFNLEKLFRVCNNRFSLKTVLMIADQMITRIESLHNRNYLHRDIKPENFCIGKGSSSKIVYIIDFGLAKSYKDTSGKHIAFKENKGLVGTARYASLNTHRGYEQSRRDDLEAIGYTLIYFLLGKLPWQNLKVEEKQQKYQKIAELKTQISIEQLCKGLPQQFVTYLNYVRKLEFIDVPDYKYLKKLFRTLFAESGYEFDYNYDWVEVFKSQYSVDTASTPNPKYKGIMEGETKDDLAGVENKPFAKGDHYPLPNKKQESKNKVPDKLELANKEPSPLNPTSRRVMMNSTKPTMLLSEENRNKDPPEENMRSLIRKSTKITTLSKIIPTGGTYDSPMRKRTIIPESLAKNMSINSDNSSKNIDLNLSREGNEEEIPAEIAMNKSTHSIVGAIKQFHLKKKITLDQQSEETLVAKSQETSFKGKSFIRGKTRTFADAKESKRSPFAAYSLVEMKHPLSAKLIDTKMLNGNEHEGDLNESSICEWEDGNNLDQMINQKRFFVNNKNR